MPVRRSWLPFPADTHFSLSNIPFGIISTPGNETKRVATAIGDHALDISALLSSSAVQTHTAFAPLLAHAQVFTQPSLNGFAALGRAPTDATRALLQDLLAEDTPYAPLLRDDEPLQKRVLIPRADVALHLPFAIGDYTDFYAGIHHATNCGRLLRGIGNELQPNYKHLPVGYHGRASSVVVSGTNVTRPSGQVAPPTADSSLPKFGPCERLDFELELGCFVARANAMGSPISARQAYAEYLFGVVLLNDWSARDVQAWEMVPLGPFNAKNFATSVSGWVVTMGALEPFLGPGVDAGQELLPYFGRRGERESLVPDIKLEVMLSSPTSPTPTPITQTTSSNLLFSFPQMLAHHSINGCPFRVGDLLGSGTISGPERGSFGSLLEQTAGGREPLTLASGETRSFLADGDVVSFTGVCGDEQFGRVGFGECVGRILPAVRFEW